MYFTSYNSSVHQLHSQWHRTKTDICDTHNAGHLIKISHLECFETLSVGNEALWYLWHYVWNKWNVTLIWTYEKGQSQSIPVVSNTGCWELNQRIVRLGCAWRNWRGVMWLALKLIGSAQWTSTAFGAYDVIISTQDRTQIKQRHARTFFSYLCAPFLEGYWLLCLTVRQGISFHGFNMCCFLLCHCRSCTLCDQVTIKSVVQHCYKFFLVYNIRTV